VEAVRRFSRQVRDHREENPYDCVGKMGGEKMSFKRSMKFQGRLNEMDEVVAELFA